MLASVSARGTTIYDTGSFTADGGAIASDFSSFAQGGSYQCADDFILSSASQLTGLNWWGIYAFDNIVQGPDAFTVRIFSDAGITPSSSPLFEFSLGDLGRVDTGVDSFGLEVYAYSGLLPSPVNLESGTTYWLSIVNNTEANATDNWFWQRVTRFSGQVAVRESDSDYWGTLYPATLAFNLQGTVIPEPSTYALSVAASALVLLLRRCKGGNCTRRPPSRIDP